MERPFVFSLSVGGWTNPSVNSMCYLQWISSTRLALFTCFPEGKRFSPYHNGWRTAESEAEETRGEGAGIEQGKKLSKCSDHA